MSSKFKKNYKKALKQGKDKNKFIYVLRKLASGEKLDFNYKDHALINDKTYKNCRECHIEPDWLLVYKYNDDYIELILVATGSHSKILNK